MLLDVEGGQLYYEVRSAGPLLVFVCGGPTDADVFAPIADVLADSYKLLPDGAEVMAGMQRAHELGETDVMAGFGQLAHRTGMALAEALPVGATLFPGGHGGYGRYVPEFAEAIAFALR
jgi:hypothetical protein